MIGSNWGQSLRKKWEDVKKLARVAYELVHRGDAEIGLARFSVLACLALDLTQETESDDKEQFPCCVDAHPHQQPAVRKPADVGCAVRPLTVTHGYFYNL